MFKFLAYLFITLWLRVRIRTIGQFLDLVLQTSIEGPQNWLERFKRRYEDPCCGCGRWEHYSEMPLTAEAVQELANIFASQAGSACRGLFPKKAREVRQKGIDFLEELYQAARRLGFRVERRDIVYINDPENCMSAGLESH